MNYISAKIAIEKALAIEEREKRNAERRNRTYDSKIHFIESALKAIDDFRETE